MHRFSSGIYGKHKSLFFRARLKLVPATLRFNPQGQCSPQPWVFNARCIATYSGETFLWDKGRKVKCWSDAPLCAFPPLYGSVDGCFAMQTDTFRCGKWERKRFGKCGKRTVLRLQENSF
ncbi:hypothetical protein CEXT_27951 [Caerostris extrusa]|uniref:Uncharacterized protein n=1 Tax=Caerostris extrusa TaxID=172846 RepID=A0AAV4MRS2_CAEEX|nr:hypothetical protein CEXT_27951 [Caerostris extrusa]